MVLRFYDRHSEELHVSPRCCHWSCDDVGHAKPEAKLLKVGSCTEFALLRMHPGCSPSDETEAMAYYLMLMVSTFV